MSVTPKTLNIFSTNIFRFTVLGLIALGLSRALISLKLINMKGSHYHAHILLLVAFYGILSLMLILSTCLEVQFLMYLKLNFDRL